MTKKITIFLTLHFFFSFTSYSQVAKSRSLLQQNFISNFFISPQLGKAPLKISRTSQIDSLFKAIQTGWEKVANDSLQKYSKKLTLEEFNNMDAYCYFWTLASITQNLNIGSVYGDYLVKNYMAPAMHRDYMMLRRLPDPDLISTIHGGNLGNTLAIGSGKRASKETFFKTFNIYKDFSTLFDSLAKSPDTALSHAATKQIENLTEYNYPFNTRNSFYKGEFDKAFTLLVTGLNVDKYSRSGAIDIALKLITKFNSEGAQDKSFAVLNTLAIYTTPDNLNRDTLRTWYSKVDPIQGKKMYTNLLQRLSTSAFKQSDQHIELPRIWDFALNALSPDKIKKAKYIIADFWYTGCGPCIEEIPELNAFFEKLKSRDDVIFISFNADYTNGKSNKEYVTKRSKELGVKYPVFYDNNSIQLNKQLSVFGYPAKFILTKSGNLISKTDQSDMSIKSFELFLKEHKYSK